MALELNWIDLWVYLSVTKDATWSKLRFEGKKLSFTWINFNSSRKRGRGRWERGRGKHPRWQLSNHWHWVDQVDKWWAPSWGSCRSNVEGFANWNCTGWNLIEIPLQLDCKTVIKPKVQIVAFPGLGKLQEWLSEPKLNAGVTRLSSWWTCVRVASGNKLAGRLWILWKSSEPVIPVISSPHN